MNWRSWLSATCGWLVSMYPAFILCTSINRWADIIWCRLLRGWTECLKISREDWLLIILGSPIIWGVLRTERQRELIRRKRSIFCLKNVSRSGEYCMGWIIPYIGRGRLVREWHALCQAWISYWEKERRKRKNFFAWLRKSAKYMLFVRHRNRPGRSMKKSVILRLSSQEWQKDCQREKQEKQKIEWIMK